VKKKHDEGFSLVELLVSIVILAAIVLPTCTSLVLSYRLNAKSRDMMQAQLAVSSTVETLMAQGIDAERVATLKANNQVNADQHIIYDCAWDSEKSELSQTDDYPEVVITITEDKSADGYVTLTVSDDDGLVTVTTQIRTQTGGGTP
jgi:prepilin-type N-terminal cleavage/methylation domain-containing protein